MYALIWKLEINVIANLYLEMVPVLNIHTESNAIKGTLAVLTLITLIILLTLYFIGYGVGNINTETFLLIFTVTLLILINYRGILFMVL